MFLPVGHKINKLNKFTKVIFNVPTLIFSTIALNTRQVYPVQEYMSAVKWFWEFKFMFNNFKRRTDISSAKKKVYIILM